MREEMVSNGVKFLQHPNVQTTPLSERVSFLEQKGMTKEEIQEAIERHQSGGGGVAVSPAAAPSAAAPVAYAPAAGAPPPHMVMAAAAPMQQIIRRSRYPAYVRLLWTVSSLVGAASILTFLWNYAVQAGYLPWFRTPRMMLEAAKVDEEREEEKKKDAELLSSLSDVSTAIQAQTAELVKLSESLDQKEQEVHGKSLVSAQIASSLTEQATMQSIAELKAEISTLKALLMTRNEPSDGSATASTSSNSGKATSSSTAATTASASAAAPPAVPVKPKETKRERMLNTLKKLRTENSREQLELAAGILGMYVKNLVENPDVPRYRRVARGNVNFKQKIEPLKHHEELLKSIGFEPAGLNMEWKWHTASRVNGDFDENIAILRALLAALQSLTSKSAASNLSLEEIAEASLVSISANRTAGRSSADEALENKAPTPAAPSTSGVTPPNVFQTGSHGSSSLEASGRSPPDLNSFMARLERKASAVNDSGVANGNASAAATAVTTTAENGAAAVAPIVTEGAKTEGGPAYPKSFTEVMELIKKGEPVPGIREIEEKLSADSTTLLKDSGDSGSTGTEVAAAAAPARPWEKMLKA